MYLCLFAQIPTYYYYYYYVLWNLSIIFQIIPKFLRYLFIYLLWLCRFLNHTQRRAALGRTLLGRMIISLQRPLPDNTQHIQQTNIHAPGGIRTHDRSRQAAVDLRLGTRGHWDSQFSQI
jgi:hypothetical protein